MAKELVSIIIPVYQSVKYLERAVLSILAQTYRPIEVLLVDDGSEKRVGMICDKLAKKYEEVKVFHREHLGVSAARNYGIEQAKGKYIQFVDADDVICANMTEQLVDTLQENHTYMSVCGYEVKNGQKSRKERIWEKADFTGVVGTEKLYEIVKSDVLSVVWNKLYIRERIRHKFDESLILCEDSVFCTEYFLDNPRLAICPKILYRYYLNSENMQLKGQRVSGYKGIKKYYFRNKKLIKEIKNKSRQRDAEMHIAKVFFYGVYTYIFEALPYSGLGRVEKVALLESIMRDRIYKKAVFNIKKLYWKEKCYKFASRLQSGKLMYLMIYFRKCLLDVRKNA